MDYKKDLAPDISEYWLLWRPVMNNVCSFREMFVDEIFSFEQIFAMHEMLDLRVFDHAYARYSAEKKPKGDSK